MSDLMPKFIRRITVSFTSAALVLSSFGMAGLAGARPAAAQGLGTALAPLAIHGVAPEQVRSRPHARPARPGHVRPGHVRPGHVRPGYAHPGYRPGYRPGVRPPAPGWHAHWGQPYWRNGGWYYRNNTGAWIAAGAAGLAIGAAAGAAAASSNDAVAYCSQRFRSYNPATGTYTGYDGLQHPCP